MRVPTIFDPAVALAFAGASGSSGAVDSRHFNAGVINVNGGSNDRDLRGKEWFDMFTK